MVLSSTNLLASTDSTRTKESYRLFHLVTVGVTNLRPKVSLTAAAKLSRLLWAFHNSCALAFVLVKATLALLARWRFIVFLIYQKIRK